MMIAAALAMSVQIHYIRALNDQDNSSVEIALEYGDLLKVAALSDRPPLELLLQCQEEGLTTLVLLDEQALSPDAKLLLYLEAYQPLVAVQLSNKEEYLQTSTGAMEVLVKAVEAPNLQMLFFAGYEVLGWPNQAEELGQALAYINLPLGYVEMLGEQKGLDGMMEKMQYRMVRIHPGYPYESQEDMARSVRERGVRFLFLKPFKNMGLIDPELQRSQVVTVSELPQAAAADEVLLDYIRTLRQSLLQSGFTTGQASRVAAVGLNDYTSAYLCTGIAAAALLLLAFFSDGLRFGRAVLAVAAVVLLALPAALALGLLEVMFVREAFALLAAFVFPSFGPLRAWRRRHNIAVDEPVWRPGLQALLESSLFTLAGAIIVNALLTDTIYTSGWRPFRGVKLALLAPPLLLLTYVLWQKMRDGFTLADLSRLSPKRLLWAGAGLAAGAVYLLRSGNEVSTISGIEAALRLNLESIFGARPRFKEFLLGHPATMLLGLNAALRLPEVLLGLLLLTAVAQASIFNTFMHLHAPLLLGMQRTLWGLALGEVIGAALLWTIRER